SSPSVKGFFRPVIFVPSVLLDRLEKSSFELILLHELYHVKRGDLWMNYLQAMVHVLHFYNPVIWLANYQILKYREIATDEAVLTHQHINVKDYSHTLLNTAELTIASPVPQTFALCVAETKSKLQERIESILKRPRAKSSQLGWSGWLVITVLGFVLLPMSSARLVAGSIGDNEHFAQSNDLSVVEKIDSKVEEIFEASNAADLEAYLAHFSEEASELHPGIEGIYGKDAVRRSMLNREMGRVQFFDAEYGDRIIWDCGGWVIEVGNIDFEFSFRNNPERLVESRQFLTLWSYEGGEDLKVRLLSWNKRIDPKLANHHEDPVVLNLNSGFSGELSAFENHPEIEAVEDAYHVTLVEQNYDETLTFVSDDIIYVPMNRGIIFGLKQFEKMIKESGIPLQKIKRESAKIWGNDDMLVVLNIFNWVLEEPQNSRDSFLGKGVHIWKKMPDGQWKLFLDTNNLNAK
ncbi:MAG: DUF4440 domain-containing protein, partial [Opitutales bacterium]|nr:DUF4440 domain-containing protein [Opitutales bacterium]